MLGWLGWNKFEKFVLYRLSRRNRRSLIRIEEILADDKVINSVFRELTIMKLGAILTIVERIRDEKRDAALIEADHKMARAIMDKPLHVFKASEQPPLPDGPSQFRPPD